MDTRADGRPVDSYEQRDDLALRSAVGDPAVEPRFTPPTQSPKHTTNPSSDSTISGQSRAKKTVNPNQSNGTFPKDAMAGQAVAGSLPDFIIKRNELFDKLKNAQHAKSLVKEKPEINVVLDLGLDKDGKPRPEMPVAAKAWESTPGSFLRHVDKDVSSDVVVAKLDGNQLWDLDRPLEYACRVSYVPFSSAEGRNVFWHSSAHVLGEAAECHFNCLLSHGPPVEQGFFYDMAIADR